MRRSPVPVLAHSRTLQPRLVSGRRSYPGLGQQAITSRDNPQIEVKEVDTQVVTAWVRDMFYFDEEPLASIMETLARWYEFRVVFENENAKQRRFTLEVSRYADIDKVLNFIEETRVVKCRKEGNTIYIK